MVRPIATYSYRLSCSGKDYGIWEYWKEEDEGFFFVDEDSGATLIVPKQWRSDLPDKRWTIVTEEVQ